MRTSRAVKLGAIASLLFVAGWTIAPGWIRAQEDPPAREGSGPDPQGDAGPAAESPEARAADAGDRPARVGDDRWLGPTDPPDDFDPDRTGWEPSGLQWQPPPSPGLGSKLAVLGIYGGAYGVATKVGTRYGLDGQYKIVRLESAYAYDLVGHVFMVREVAGFMGTATHLVGYDARASRNFGAWLGAFGAYTWQEILNGFMPGVRFDPLDPLANALGAWLATGGRDLAARHENLQRLSLQFGYRDWSRMVGPAQGDAPLGNVWHDHPNGRFGLGYDIGPLKRPWLTPFLSYEVTSLSLAELENRFGVGVELQPVNWLAPVLLRLPGGPFLVSAFDWFNDRLLMPGLYVQLWQFDAAPFSDREPFQE